MNNRIGKFFVVLGIITFCGCTSMRDTKNAEYSLLRGVNLCEQGDLEGALREYNKSFEIAPENIILLKEMAFVYYNFGDYNKAEEFWQKALKLSPKDDEIIKNLATMYYQNGDYSKTLTMIAESYNPNSDYYLQLKGLIEYQNHEYKKAYSFFTRMNKKNMDEKTYVAYLDIINKIYDNKRYYSELKKGRNLFTGAKEYTLLYARELAGRFEIYDEAEQVLLEYLMNMGNDSDILTMLSWVYRESGDFEKAQDTLKLLEDRQISA